MTAEMAVLNRAGVALAADSAVTATVFRSHPARGQESGRLEFLFRDSPPNALSKSLHQNEPHHVIARSAATKQSQSLAWEIASLRS